MRTAELAAIGAVVALGEYLAAVRPPLTEIGLAVLLGGRYLGFVGRPLRAAATEPTPRDGRTGG